MGNSRAITVRKRALRRANDRAQRRFHAMLESGLFFDETARVTRLYVEAERLIDRLLVPDEHLAPVTVVEHSLRAMSRVYRGVSFRSDNLASPDESEQLAQYWNRGA